MPLGLRVLGWLAAAVMAVAAASYLGSAPAHDPSGHWKEQPLRLFIQLFEQLRSEPS